MRMDRGLKRKLHRFNLSESAPSRFTGETVYMGMFITELFMEPIIEFFNKSAYVPRH